MRNVFVSLGLAGIVFLVAGCCVEPKEPVVTGPPMVSLPITHAEYRISQAPSDIIRATIHYSSTTHLLTVSNSTDKPIQLPTPPEDHCYADTFWFYGWTPNGWQPKQPYSSYFCGVSSMPSESIPSQREIEIDMFSLLSSRNIYDIRPYGTRDYVVKVQYLDSLGQESFAYAYDLHNEPSSFLVVVRSTGTEALAFTVTNTSSRPLWLAPMCCSTELAGGWMDEEHTTMQRLTDAGTWSPLHVPAENCAKTLEMIEIAPDEAKVIDGAEWLQNAGVSLQVGRYRWDVVIYKQRIPYSTYGRHVFGDMFEYEIDS